jgi:hypothetical protein
MADPLPPPGACGGSKDDNLTDQTGSAVANDPWMSAMRRGDFERAWQISDAALAARLAAGGQLQRGPRHFQTVWNGKPLAGKRVLVRCYHGLGDTVQFIRFAAALRKLAREVIVWVQPPLLALAATAPGVDRVLPLHDGVPDAAFDGDIEIMELAHALRVHNGTITCEVPYLFPAPRKARLPYPSAAQNVEGGSSDELCVGVVWHAGDWDARRSVPAELLAPLAHVSGVRLFSLQRGPATTDATRIPAPDLSSDDVEAAAATLGALDLLICVDTFVAHLGGALGVPVWLMLHTDCDWRWREHGSTTVWYPTMRLFRQPRSGDWKSVVVEIAEALQPLTKPRESASKLSGTNVCMQRSASVRYLPSLKKKMILRKRRR